MKGMNKVEPIVGLTDMNTNWRRRLLGALHH